MKSEYCCSDFFCSHYYWPSSDLIWKVFFGWSGLSKFVETYQNKLGLVFIHDSFLAEFLLVRGVRKADQNKTVGECKQPKPCNRLCLLHKITACYFLFYLLVILTNNQLFSDITGCYLKIASCKWLLRSCLWFQNSQF